MKYNKFDIIMNNGGGGININELCVFNDKPQSRG